MKRYEYDLTALNEQMFSAEARNDIEGKPWNAFLEIVLSEDFVLRRSRSDVPDESKVQLMNRIGSVDYSPAIRTIRDDSVRVWSSEELAVVKCVVTVADNPQAYHNVKVFIRAVSRSWCCVYWQVTAAP